MNLDKIIFRGTLEEIEKLKGIIEDLPEHCLSMEGNQRSFEVELYENIKVYPAPFLEMREVRIPETAIDITMIQEMVRFTYKQSTYTVHFKSRRDRYTETIVEQEIKEKEDLKK